MHDDTDKTIMNHSLTHNHVNGLVYSNGSSSDKRHNDRGGGRGRLEQNSRENTNHQSSNGVYLVAKNTTSSTSSENLGSGSKKLETKEEEVEEEARECKFRERSKPTRRECGSSRCGRPRSKLRRQYPQHLRQRNLHHQCE